MNANLIPILAALLACSSSLASAQVFSNASSQIPATASQTENVDFADVDHDGDWDATISDGGDTSQDQNRIYINRGGLQGATVGFFQDETAARMPVVSTDGRDIEFVDFDNDGDVDLYTSNTSQLLNQSNRWWTNKGGKQGTPAQLGFYQEDTLTRWVGLGGSGSSVAPSSVLVSGGFIDWSCDCDFGDVDNDGDIDLFHATYGGAFGGLVPSRIYLNDGDGHFSEFNPSGFQLSGTQIANGNPGIWCQGTQSANTTNSTGTNCDIASSALDIDLQDMDGDFDIDVLHGARQEAPRIFQNRLQENAGVLQFRDVSGSAWPAGYWSGGDNYEQEMGDMDNDGDVDIYGLNYPGLSDAVYNNASSPGSLSFNGMQTLASSSNDDNEADFLDYDADGDLDVFVAAFQSTNRLYQDTYSGGAPGSFAYTFISAASSGLTSSRALDADEADVDFDGDPDVMTAEDGGQHEILYKNTLSSNDTSAPRIPAFETIANNAASGGNWAVRAQVYDNASYYTTWYNPTYLEVTVAGIRVPDIRMQSSQGQIFRGLIPKNLFGAVVYKVRSADQYGNTTTSTSKSYTATGGPVGTLYGSSTNGTLGVLTLQALSLPLLDNPLYLAGGNVPSSTPGFIVLSISQAVSPINLGSGLLSNLGFPLLYLAARTSDSAGKAVIFVAVPSAVSGVTLNAQYIAVNGTGGNTFAVSRGLAIPIP